ncbi:MAG: hypothetical protein R3A11_08570 [Bdellovibrionota bacterium]
MKKHLLMVGLISCGVLMHSSAQAQDRKPFQPYSSEASSNLEGDQTNAQSVIVDLTSTNELSMYLDMNAKTTSKGQKVYNVTVKNQAKAQLLENNDIDTASIVIQFQITDKEGAISTFEQLKKFDLLKALAKENGVVYITPTRYNQMVALRRPNRKDY